MPFGPKILNAEQVLTLDALTVGPPAMLLARLQQHGLPTHEFFVITPEAFWQFLDRAGMGELFDYQFAGSDLGDRERRRTISRLITDRLDATPFHPEFQAELEALLATSFSGELFSLRPSYGGIAAAERAFVPTWTDPVGVAERGEVLRAIRSAWCSAFGEESLEYRNRHRLSLRGIRLSLIIGAVPAATVSGTLATGNPLAARPDEVVLIARPGLPAASEAASQPSDVWLIEPRTGRARFECALKASQRVYHPGPPALVQLEPVPDPEQTRPSLALDQIERLRQIAQQARAQLGTPLELDWVLEGDRVCLLEARSLANLAAAGGRQRVWDGASLAESLVGSLRPLSFSLTLRFYRTAYRELLRAFGLRDPDPAVEGAIDGIVGQLGGQLYSNPEALARLLEFLPGYPRLRRFIEKRPPGSTASRPRQGSLGYWLSWYWGLDRAVARAWRTLARLPRPDLPQADLDGLLGALRDLEGGLGGFWRALAVNELFAATATSALERLLLDWKLDSTGELARDWVALDDAPAGWTLALAVMRLAIDIQDSPPLLDLFGKLSPDKLAKRLLDRPEGGFNTRLEQLVTMLDRLGEPHLDPDARPMARQQVLAWVASYLTESGVSLARLERARQARRRRAELAINASTQWHPLRRAVLRALRDGAVRFRRHQIQARSARSELYARSREILLAIGQRLVQQGALERVDDITWLTVEDLQGFVEGASTCPDLLGLAALRRSAWAGGDRALPTRLITLGAVHRANQALATPVATASEPTPMICGTVVVPGSVLAPARVLTDPRQPATCRGEILILPYADPRWTPLLPLAKGVVIERGSALSHLVQIARELEIPTLIGVPDVCRVAVDGQLVEIEAQTGAIWLDAVEPLEPVPPSA